MALSTTGPLRLSAIEAELGVTAPFSLRSMSAAIGLSTPDSINGFYDYSASSGVLLISLGFDGKDPGISCSIKAATYYSDSDNFSESTTLFTDEAGEIVADPGFYSNGFLSREWTGEEFKPEVYDCGKL